MTHQIDDLEALLSVCDDCSKLSQTSLSKEKPVVIFGAGGFGKNVFQILSSAGFEVSAFVETNPKAQFVHGIPVYKLSNIPSLSLNAQLVIGIFNRSTPYQEIHSLACSQGFKEIFFPWQLFDNFSEDFGWRYWLSSPSIFSENKHLIHNAFIQLYDSISQEIFLRIIKFRIGHDLNFSAFKSQETQYFNDITLSSISNQGISFVDCGAYNGDTFEELSNIRKIDSAYLFEPDPINFKKLVAKVSNLGHKALCLPLAVSNKYEMLSFSGEVGESGTFANEGLLTVSTVSIDELFQFHKINFLKFDVEGGELAAIIGAESIIKNQLPVLAISLYHKPADLWQIPLLIHKLSTNYKLFIRQHWYNSFDSVLYAVPNKPQ
jgi:FkbM family methyltransferase